MTVAPRLLAGLLFNPAEVTAGWIRFGGILLTLIGMQVSLTHVPDQQPNSHNPGF
jgi:hypothetical protein